ncbi:tRNA 4-thiouridine(8) synthase ThiI [Candidatus Peregrinibacteria bacterium CG10_big_fil_rev_8_21_14_0_10_36_19]|nr:MAG: tRNA 4-thiouridine(8) synthase ThiI [Candidatus Peregrinibacteria bacterium CG10_big_fil_rev_8_21_14_0_10_36_19]
MKRFIIIHYGEIGLKRANLDYFVEKMRKQVKYKLEKRFSATFVVKHTLKRIFVPLPDRYVESEYVEVLEKIFGIKTFRFVYEGSLDLDDLGEGILKYMPTFDVLPSSFRVSCKRSMQLPYKSVEAERYLGAYLLKNDFSIPVKMKDPDLTIGVEFFNNKSFFYYKTYKGLGGLSACSQGRLVSLISSGIDSPVASWLMMRRGARVIFVHFHSFPFSDDSEMTQVEDLVNILAQYQDDSKLYFVPFGEFQNEVGRCLEIPGSIRTILYRRMMFRVADAIAKKESAKGLITGESFGQVASQTAENMFVVDEASNIPVYRPLVAYDKEDIVNLAEKIGTYDISKLPSSDTCTMFTSRKPELKANLFDTASFEENLDLKLWEDKLIEESEIKFF